MYQILIIKLGALGDVLRTTSILKGLKEKYKDCKITWITNRECIDLLKNNRDIDELLEYGIKLKDSMTGKEFDLVICLDDEQGACELASRVKAKELYGAYLDNKGRRSYTDNAALWFDMGLLSKFGKEKADQMKKENKKTYQDILEEILKITTHRPVLKLAKEESDFGKKFAEKHRLNNVKLIIGVNSSAGHRWSLKRLPTEKTIDLVNKLSDELKAKVILLGGPEEIERNKEIMKKTKAIDGGCNNTLMQFASIIDLCHVVVCSDSLAMHIALALNKKTVAFFAPTSAAEIEMYNLGRKVISNSDCYCCYRKDADFHPNCMDAIEAEDIYKAVKEVL